MLNEIFNRFFVKLAEFKNYFARASTYISLVNFVLLLATFKKTYNLQISVVLVTLIGLSIITITGIIDYKFIFLKQNTHAYYKTPSRIEFDRINLRLDEIKQRLEK